MLLYLRRPWTFFAFFTVSSTEHTGRPHSTIVDWMPKLYSRTAPELRCTIQEGGKTNDRVPVLRTRTM